MMKGEEKMKVKGYEPIRLRYTVPISDHRSIQRNTLKKALELWPLYHEGKTAKVNVYQIVRAGGYPVEMSAGQLTIQLD